MEISLVFCKLPKISEILSANYPNQNFSLRIYLVFGIPETAKNHNLLLLFFCGARGGDCIVVHLRIAYY